ncbi:MAG TPA: TAXI family TRAP transporter solute-binding subunit [Jiangellaceae bacterium]
MMRISRSRTSLTVRLGAALAAMALVAVACGDDDDNGDATGDGDQTEEPGDAGEEMPSVLTMGTGSTGGTYFPLGGAIAGVWSGNIEGMSVSTQASGASVENLQLLAQGEIDLAMAINGTASSAMAGEGDFEGQEYDITYLGAIYREVYQIVARADAGIATVEDLAGKTVAIGPPGSGTAVFAEALLQRAGIELGEARQETFGEAADLLRDGTIDASIGVLALPAGSLEEVARATDLVMVSLEGDLLQQTLEEDPTLTETQYEPGTYTGIDEPATLVTNWASLYSRADLPEEAAYQLAKVMYEMNTDIAAAHAVGEEIQLDTALEGAADVPVHPGAKRFFDEAGAG